MLRRMIKRSVAAVLWFLTAWWAYSIVAFFLGQPTDGGMVLGALAAAFVWMDPSGDIWGPKTHATSSDAPGEGLGSPVSSR
jgi:hypothetical protein